MKIFVKITFTDRRIFDFVQEIGGISGRTMAAGVKTMDVICLQVGVIIA